MKGFISGATGFLGKTLVSHFLDAGNSLTISGRDPIKLNNLRDELMNAGLSDGAELKTIHLDFSNPKTLMTELYSLDSDTYDWCINTAGIQGAINPNSKLALDDYEQALAINLLSPIELSRYFINRFTHQNRGVVIHISGGGGTGARPFFSPYSISKTGLIRFVENTALEIAQQNVQIYVVSPGVMPSNMLRDILKKPEYLSQSQLVEIETVLNSSSNYDSKRMLGLLDYLLSDSAKPFTGKLISAVWDNWNEWGSHLEDFEDRDLYTLRRVTARDRGHDWGDL